MLYKHSRVMPVVKLINSVAALCVLFVLGCSSSSPTCPTGTPTVDPMVIPDGSNSTTVTVVVDGDDGRDVSTEVTADTGTIADPFALETTYTCPFDFAGEAEICATTTTAPDDATECETTRCTQAVCPEVKNVCPTVSSLTVMPAEIEGTESAVIEVVADDPDHNPEPLSTRLTANFGTIADPTSDSTTYTCDPEVGGIMEICVVASDGDESCDARRCTSVRCPGTPLENTCPIIEEVSAHPTNITGPEPTSDVRAVATDPDEFPAPLRIEWSAATGVFDDRFAHETTFTCGASGPVEICARANDGDPACNVQSCLTAQCPGELPVNLCPQLFVINSVPRVIPDGENSTLVQTRAQDTDGVPVPLSLTLNALWGSFENTENIEEPLNVVTQNANYVCDRPGLVEVCVDATDGACAKTLCDTIICPDDVPVSP